jgi:hypothetical protein
MIYQSWLSNDWALDFESDWVNQSRKMPLADLARPLWFLSTASFNSAGNSLIALHLSSECPLVLDSWHGRTKLERYYHISLTAKVYRWASTEYIASIDYKCLWNSHYMYYLLHRRRLQIQSLIPRWLEIRVEYVESKSSHISSSSSVSLLKFLVWDVISKSPSHW